MCLLLTQSFSFFYLCPIIEFVKRPHRLGLGAVPKPPEVKQKKFIKVCILAICYRTRDMCACMYDYHIAVAYYAAIGSV